MKISSFNLQLITSVMSGITSVLPQLTYALETKTKNINSTLLRRIYENRPPIDIVDIRETQACLIIK